MLHGAHHSFGLGEWDIGPISLPPSRPLVNALIIIVECMASRDGV